MADRTGIDRRASMRALGDVWGDVGLSAPLNEVGAVIAFVGTDGDLASSFPLEHL
jgi:hypothetical protein